MEGKSINHSTKWFKKAPFLILLNGGKATFSQATVAAIAIIIITTIITASLSHKATVMYSHPVPNSRKGWVSVVCRKGTGNTIYQEPITRSVILPYWVKPSAQSQKCLFLDFLFSRNKQRVSYLTNHNVGFYYVPPGDHLAFYPIHWKMADESEYQKSTSGSGISRCRVDMTQKKTLYLELSGNLARTRRMCLFTFCEKLGPFSRMFQTTPLRVKILVTLLYCQLSFVDQAVRENIYIRGRGRKASEAQENCYLREKKRINNCTA